MTEIREYNLATGHVEVLATVANADATVVRWYFDDHSTDHVVYLHESEES